MESQIKASSTFDISTLTTKDQCLDSLFHLFEERIKEFQKLTKLVDAFKVDLNMYTFAEQCQSITLDFQKISLSIRQVFQFQQLLYKIESKLRDDLHESKLASKIREIQDQEKLHLEKRVMINDKLVKLAQQMYELNKKRIILKEIEECDVNEIVVPKVREIDELKGEESLILREINDKVEELRELAYYEDEY